MVKNGPKNNPLTTRYYDTPNDKIVVAYQEPITTKTYLIPIKDNGFGPNLINDINL